MYISVTQVITYGIGAVVVLAIAIPVLVKWYFSGKVKGKMVVRTVSTAEEEYSEPVTLDGITTAPNRRNKSYHPIGKHKDPETGKMVGNTFETWYPEGLPRVFQTRVRAMSAPENNPSGINYYGDVTDLRATAEQVALFKKEAFGRAVIAASEDAKEIINEFRRIKPINKTLIYILLGVAIIAIIGVGFLVFQNSQAINNLQWW